MLVQTVANERLGAPKQRIKIYIKERLWHPRNGLNMYTEVWCAIARSSCCRSLVNGNGHIVRGRSLLHGNGLHEGDDHIP